MTGMAAPLLVILLAVLAEGFFSGSEMAIVSCRWARLRREAERGDRRAALLVRLWRDPDRFLATTLVGTNLAVITASVQATWIAVTLAHESPGRFPWLAGREEILVILLLTPFTLLFGEIIPKSFFQSRADRMAKRVAWPMAFFRLLFHPVTSVLTFFSGLVKRLVRSRVGASPFVSREELALVVRLRDLRTELSSDEQRMIRRLFTFRETRVEEVMVPLEKVAALDEGAGMEEALRRFGQLRYTRYPVYRGQPSNVVGVFDILTCRSEPIPGRKVGRLMKPAHFVPGRKSLVDLLREMERERTRLAVVVDEYGAAVGIVTLEDVLEEIVGELEDEYAV